MVVLTDEMCFSDLPDRELSPALQGLRHFIPTPGRESSPELPVCAQNYSRCRYLMDYCPEGSTTQDATSRLRQAMVGASTGELFEDHTSSQSKVRDSGGFELNVIPLYATIAVCYKPAIDHPLSASFACLRELTISVCPPRLDTTP